MRGVSSQVSGKVSVLGCPDRASVKVRKKIVHSEVKRLTGYSLGTRSSNATRMQSLIMGDKHHAISFD
jgi:hypothetical protein